MDFPSWETCRRVPVPFSGGFLPDNTSVSPLGSVLEKPLSVFLCVCALPQKGEGKQELMQADRAVGRSFSRCT